MRISALATLLLLICAFFVGPSEARAQAGEDKQCKADKDYIQDSAERERLIEKAEKEGRLVRRVEFAGNVFTEDLDIRKRIFLNEGDRFKRDRLERSLEAVSNLIGFIGPLGIASVELREVESYPAIDISIHFFEERALSRRSELLNEDVYAQAVYSVLKRMKVVKERLIAEDFSRAIVIERGGLTSKIPKFSAGFFVEVLGKKEIQENDLHSKRGRVPVFEIDAFVNVGGFLRVRVKALGVSSNAAEMTFYASDWGDVYFVYDSDHDSLIVHAVCLCEI